MIKEFKTHAEQIAILKSKGLIVNDNSLEILRKNNYYFLINRYRKPFLESHKPTKFKQGATFEEICALCEFDRTLRNAFFKYILNTENTLKSIISYEFSLKYGYEYLSKESFDENSQKRYIDDLFNNIKQTITQGIKENSYMKHYDNSYSKFPLWVIINNFSLGVTIKFYRNMKLSDRTNISNYFDLGEAKILEYLLTINFFRNQIAHNQRFYDLSYDGKSIKDLYHILEILLDSSDTLALKNEIEEAINILTNSVKSIDIKDILRGNLL